MNKNATRPCPICGNTSVAHLLHFPFTLPENSPLPAAYDIVACDTCDFVYADTPGSQHDYDRYYYEHSKYEDPSVATGGSHDPYDLARIQAQAERIANRTTKAARILDIGCASGGLLQLLRQWGYHNLHGLDGARACIQQLNDSGIPATLARLSALGQANLNGKFDLIVLSHILEHVVDLRALLNSVRSLLAENGQIYVETPDASRYDPHAFVPYYFFDSEHINHFDIRALGQLSRANGLVVTDAGEITLEVAENLHYPACWAWLSSAPSTVSPSRSETSTLQNTIRQYVEASRARERYPLLEALAESQAPVVIWGAGAFAQRLFSRTALGQCNVIGIVDKDSNKRGKSFAGHIIASPEERLNVDQPVTLLVAAAVQFEAIAREARQLSPNCHIVRLSEQ